MKARIPLASKSLDLTIWSQINPLKYVKLVFRFDKPGHCPSMQIQGFVWRAMNNNEG